MSIEEIYMITQRSGLGWSDIYQQIVFDLRSIYLFGSGVLIIACTVALIVAFFFALCALISPKYRDSVRLAVGAGFVIGFIALIAGQLTGISREGVVGDIAPVLLTGLGALFVASVFQEKVDTGAAGLAAVAFTAVFHMGVTLGADQRERAEQFSGTIRAPIAENFDDLPGFEKPDV